MRHPFAYIILLLILVYSCGVLKKDKASLPPKTPPTEITEETISTTTTDKPSPKKTAPPPAFIEPPVESTSEPDVIHPSPGSTVESGTIESGTIDFNPAPELDVFVPKTSKSTTTSTVRPPRTSNKVVPSTEENTGETNTEEAIALVKGNMVYSLSDSMELNIASLVTLAIGKKEIEDIIKSNEVAHLIDTNNIRFQSISLSKEMSARLIDPDKNTPKFEIVSKNESNTQSVDLSGEKVTDWKWEVTPIEPGVHPLNLIVKAIIKTPSGRTMPIDIPVFNKMIYVNTIETKTIRKYSKETMDQPILYGGFILAFLLIIIGVIWWLNNRRKIDL